MFRSFVGARAPWLRRQRRTHRWSVFACILLLGLAAEHPTKKEAAPANDEPAETATPLTMEEAARLATVDQPLLTEREAKIHAEEHQAIASAQLPDPQVSGGIKELPIDSSEAFSTCRDNFPEFTIGLSRMALT
jgi:hypothetical protein